MSNLFKIQLPFHTIHTIIYTIRELLSKSKQFIDYSLTETMATLKSIHLWI